MNKIAEDESTSANLLCLFYTWGGRRSHDSVHLILSASSQGKIWDARKHFI